MMLSGKILFTTDLTAGGCCVESMRVLQPGTKLTGSIATATAEYSFSGEVRWARAGHPGIRELGHMGIRFEERSPDFESLVRADASTPPPGNGQRSG